jgi:2-(1,2-epoxy-1,2-dihydrophenyl)acetyl-CoA isomerase
MAGAADTAAYLARLAGSFHDALRAISALDAVVLAAVDGAAAGGGLGLALTADVIVAGDRARFLTAYETIGLTSDSGVSTLLPRSIGLHRAQAMTTLGLVLDADTALAWGLAARRVPSTELDAAITEIADRVSARPTAHYGTTRRLYRALDPYSEHLDAETAAISAAARNPATVANIRAFVRRAAERPPKETR